MVLKTKKHPATQSAASPFSAWRFRPTTQKGRSLNVEAESDRARVIFCEAFRALHRKAQVFSLDGRFSSRTRLTHSLEVSQIGRYLAQLILDDMSADAKQACGIAGSEEAFQVFVETACLVHDIGNPPFGHFGELAIKHWFDRRGEELRHRLCDGASKKEDEFNRLFKDFVEFDGNPQGFRIMTRLLWTTDEYGLNLTATQLASAIKYYCAPSEINSESPRLKKAGYFQTEAQIAEKIREVLGIEEFGRHPAAYVMEAADDIAYCLSDLEDAIANGLMTEKLVLDDIKAAVVSNFELTPFRQFLPEPNSDGVYGLGAFLGFRVGAVNYAVKSLACVFNERLTSFMSGSERPLSDMKPEVSALLAHLKSMAGRFIYCSPEVLRNEVVGSRVISGILDAFEDIIYAKRERFECMMSGRSRDDDGNHISVEHALLRQIPDGYVRSYRHAVQALAGKHQALQEWSFRAHMIVDFVAGLTDTQALEFYRLISAR